MRELIETLAGMALAVLILALLYLAATTGILASISKQFDNLTEGLFGSTPQTAEPLPKAAPIAATPTPRQAAIQQPPELTPIRRTPTQAPKLSTKIGPIQAPASSIEEHPAIHPQPPAKPEPRPQIAEITPSKAEPTEAEKKKKLARNAYFRPPAVCEQFKDNWDMLVECTNQIYKIPN